MRSKIFLATFAVSLLAAQAMAAPKNVVLIVADDLGRDLGCYGNRAIKTPNLDRLAADGTLFTNAFCTTASCSASRSVILSGMYNHANGQFGHEHDVHHFRTYSTVKTLSARLAETGYRTARIGKFHVGPDEVYPFDHALKGNARNATAMAEVCREVIAANDSRPFFIYFCTDDPHRGGGSGPPPYRPNPFGNNIDHPAEGDVRYDPADVVVPRYLPDTPTCRAELAQYYQATSRVDRGVGRLVQVLKETGHWDDTLLLFVSDNGIPFPGAKTTAYDPGLRLPCIVRNPYQQSRGVVCEAMISWVDLSPTILEFAGAKVTSQDMHGRSFLGILNQARPKGWDEVFVSHTFHEVTMYYPVRGVRTRQYKLLWNIAYPLTFPSASDLWHSPTWQDMLSKGPDALYGKRTIAAYLRRPQFELYDLAQDPDELVNLASDASHASVMEELKTKIKEMQRRTKDPWIHKWEYE